MATKAKTATEAVTEEEKAAAETAAKSANANANANANDTSDTDTKEAAVAEEAQTWEATLKFGETYFLRGVKFVKGVPKKVTEDVKNYLESTAIDTVTVGSKTRRSNETRAKFEFVRLRSR